MPEERREGKKRWRKWKGESKIGKKMSRHIWGNKGDGVRKKKKSGKNTSW